MVEHLLAMQKVAGSNPVSRFGQARVAQEVERVLGKDEVTGSTPVAGLTLPKKGFII